ncbi:MAG: hypothetical protein AAF800_09470 [Planctomycetota bacterium]
MNFSTDRDLLALEPTLFHDVAWVGQQRLHHDDAYLADTTLTCASADFAAAGVEAGSVVLVNRTAMEVVARQDAMTLTVSLLRARLSDTPLPATDGGPYPVTARSFAPQAELVHDGLLRLLGIDPDDDGPDALSEDAVVSLSVMARLEALGTLERVYSGAVALTGDGERLIYKAGEYRRRFRHATAQASVLLDTDGDGHADERRRLGVMRFHRV